MDFTASYQTLDFSITLANIFGNNVNHLLNIFGPMVSGVPLTDETGVFYLGEQYDLGGRTAEMVGSGFAQPGVSIAGLIVPLGLPVDVMIMRDVDTGQYLFVYPNGTPNLLGAVALVTNTSATPYSATYAGAPPVCFCHGTLIATPDGERAVEKIRAGDKVLTADGRELRVLWSGGRMHQRLAPEHRPIVFRPGSLSPGLPVRPLRISPQHRVALGNGSMRFQLGPARGFTGLPGVHQVNAEGAVGYHHLLLEHHALVQAEGVPVESLLLRRQSLRFLSPRAVFQIAAALGCDARDLADRPEAEACGQILTLKETRLAVESRLFWQQPLTPAWIPPLPALDWVD